MKPSVWFWTVGVIALLFNIFGVFDYLMTTTGGEAYLEAGGFTDEQVAYWQGMAPWRIALWAIGVFSGVTGAVLMLLRRAWAVSVFAMGPVVFVVNLLATFTDGGVAVMGGSYYVSSTIILGIITFIWWYARKQKSNGILA